jgi:hypothetical protein
MCDQTTCTIKGQLQPKILRQHGCLSGGHLHRRPRVHLSADLLRAAEFGKAACNMRGKLAFEALHTETVGVSSEEQMLLFAQTASQCARVPEIHMWRLERILR